MAPTRLWWASVMVDTMSAARMHWCAEAGDEHLLVPTAAQVPLGRGVLQKRRSVLQIQGWEALHAAVATPTLYQRFPAGGADAEALVMWLNTQWDGALVPAATVPAVVPVIAVMPSASAAASQPALVVICAYPRSMQEWEEMMR